MKCKPQANITKVRGLLKTRLVFDSPLFVYKFHFWLILKMEVEFMKITRFVNGQKITKPLSAETIIKNEIVAHTIEKVNKRLKNTVNSSARADVSAII